MARVLVTGANGRIGRAVVPVLSKRYALRLLQKPGDALGVGDVPGALAVGDVVSLEDMRDAVRGMDAVVHLAASVSMDTAWDDALSVNVAGTRNVLEAMRLEGVARIVYASSNHATGYWERIGMPCGADTALRGDSYYGASKAMAEILVRLYVDLHNLSAICLRIGSFRPEPEDARQLSTWISPRDMAQLIWRSLETPARWGVHYAISGNTRRYWDITSAVEQLGYEPEDDAERFARRFVQQVP